MKKIFTSIMLCSVAFSLSAEGGSDKLQKLSEQEKSAITNYFVKSLNNEASSGFDDNSPIKKDEISTIRNDVWNIWKNAVNEYSEEKLIELDDLERRATGRWTLPSNLEANAVMPYYWGFNGTLENEEKYPMFLYMHGSGDKASEWETGIGLSLRRFYSPGAYFIPQIPNAYGELYRWAIQSKQWAWEKLLRLAFLNDKIDANRIYFFGISEGGYGSQRLASFYADYLAGAGPMAGGEPLKNAPMENLANIAFSLRTGEEDTMFGRNLLTSNANAVADSLAKEHPGYYNNFIEVIPGYGHSIDYTPTTPWLAQYTRNPHPKYFYWENYDMYGRYRNCFYNIRVNETSRTNDSQRTCYEMNIDNNTIKLNVKNVTYTCTYWLSGIEMLFSKKFTKATKGNVTIFLNEKLFDLNKPVKIILNDKEIFNQVVPATLRAMTESCALFYDPERVFPAAIDIDIAKNSATTTEIENNIIAEKKNDTSYYRLNGNKIEQPKEKGIYIKNNKKYLVK